jgi:hypothetical protein
MPGETYIGPIRDLNFAAKPKSDQEFYRNVLDTNQRMGSEARNFYLDCRPKVTKHVVFRGVLTAMVPDTVTEKSTMESAFKHMRDTNTPTHAATAGQLIFNEAINGMGASTPTRATFTGAHDAINVAAFHYLKSIGFLADTHTMGWRGALASWGVSDVDAYHQAFHSDFDRAPGKEYGTVATSRGVVRAAQHKKIMDRFWAVGGFGAQVSPLSVIVAVDRRYLRFFPDITVELSPGDILCFRGDAVHGGSAHRVFSTGAFFYADLPTFVREDDRVCP